MFKIHFTPADLLRIRIAREPDPMCELMLSLRALRTRARGSDVHLGPWRRHVVRSVPQGHLWRVLHADERGDPDTMAAAKVSIRAYHRTGLAPFWSSIWAAVSADRAARAEQYAAGGLDRLLSSLHPRVRWHSPVLEVLDVDGPDLHLEGRGLLLQPSYFCPDTPARPRSDSDQPALVYPIIRPAGGPSIDGADADQPAAALLGRTRAAALAATALGCTTSELARRCEISVSTASHQATVLRDSGLIQTRRDGGSVVHEITDLGRRLLACAAGPIASATRTTAS
jgi:DNA-binding transcriptional ArsR family regulator